MKKKLILTVAVVLSLSAIIVFAGGNGRIGADTDAAHEDTGVIAGSDPQSQLLDDEASNLSAEDAEKYREKIYDDYSSEFLSKQDEANRIYQTLAKAFGVQIDGSGDYPDYYGGSYINDDGNLEICVICEDDELDKIREEIKEIAGSDSFILTRMTNSYTDLMTIMNRLNDYFFDPKNKTEIESLFVGFGLDEINNCIVVQLLECDDEHIAEFKSKVMDSSMITFEQGGLTVMD